MNRRGFFGVVGGLLSLLGFKGTSRGDCVQHWWGQGTEFDLEMMPLPIVHKDFDWKAYIVDDPGPELDQEKAKAWWDKIQHHHRVRARLMAHGINPTKLTSDQLDLWGRVFK